jgi:hypothetical protein
MCPLLQEVPQTEGAVSAFTVFFTVSPMFEFLVTRLSDRIKRQDTAMRACVPPKEMLAVTIR